MGEQEQSEKVMTITSTYGSWKIGRTYELYPASWFMAGAFGFRMGSAIRIEHLNGHPWYARKIPAEDHGCVSFTNAWVVGAGPIDRCSCGAYALSNGDWQNRNSRRAK